MRYGPDYTGCPDNMRYGPDYTGCPDNMRYILTIQGVLII